MLKYILGLLKNLFNPAVSLCALIDNLSKVNRKAKVYRKAKIFNSSIDSYSYIGKGTSIICAKIGKFCSIASSSIIGLGIHTLDKISTSPIFTEKNNATGKSWCKISEVYPYKFVNIGNDVWIGARVMIMGGVNIGDGAVIGAGTIVTKNVPPYAIVAGVPATIIHYRFEKSIIDKLLEIQWWNASEDKLKKNIDYFQDNNVTTDFLTELETRIK